MAKLYPPNIEGKLPAFTGTTLVVPFSMNRVVGFGEVKSLLILIKSINKDAILFTGLAITFSSSEGILNQSSSTNFGENKVNCFASFDITESVGKFTIGQYYRIQLAYIGKDDVLGYYSSVGVTKYTTLPIISISSLTLEYTNTHLYDYTGIYELNKDTGDATEKLYSSYMKLWTSDGQLVYASDEIIHSTMNDTEPNLAIEVFNIPFDLERGKIYRLRYYVTTINNLFAYSPEYRIMMMDNGGVEMELMSALTVHADCNFDRGTIDVSFTHKNPKVKVLNGMYRVSRAENKQPFEWKHIRTLFCANTSLSKLVVSDFTVELGVSYLYSILQYNNSGVDSSRIISEPVTADFEDYFLIDPERQLKIRYNPKISSMKNTIVENRMNTIGSKYPYFVRSGVVNYKEFSLSGLVSYHMDDTEDFVKWEDLGFDMAEFSRKNEHGILPDRRIPDYNLTMENIMAERLFKLDVLDWLNNGKPKILKSPTEGNYLVMLTGVSMTPLDQVGRMLHQFSAQAVEISDFNYDALTYYKFFGEFNRSELMQVPQWRTIELAYDDIDGSGNHSIKYTTGELITPGTSVTEINILNMVPSTVIHIDDEPIVIGATGAYHAEITKGVTSIVIPTDYQGGGSVTIQENGPMYTQFDRIYNYYDRIIADHQFIGHSGTTNILSGLTNIRQRLIDLILIRLYKRTVVDIYCSYDYSTEGVPLKKDWTYDADGTEIVAQLYNSNLRSSVYDLENPSVLFKLNWLNWYYDENDNKQYFDIRDVSYPVLHDDGTFSEITELLYYWTDSDGEHTLPIYSGYYYDPLTSLIIEDSYDLFDVVFGQNDEEYLGLVNYTVINMAEKEHMIYDSSFKPDIISLGDGVIADLTYTQLTIIYSYENSVRSVMDKVNAYNTAVGLHRVYVEGTGTGEAEILTWLVPQLGGYVTKTSSYTNCVTDLERYYWRLARAKKEAQLLLNVKVTYAELLQALNDAYLADATKGAII